MALKAGHEVVCLPVAHCTLNPIELAWAQVKGHIKANTRDFNLTEVKHLAWEVEAPAHWSDLIKHVRDKVEEHYWQVDGLGRQYIVPKFTIRIRRRSGDDPKVESSSKYLTLTILWLTMMTIAF